MVLFLKQAIIADPRSAFHNQQADILIQDGVITSIGTLEAPAGARVIERPGLHVSPGWTDVFAQLGDPGLEFKETLESGSAAAAAGGYCRVMVLPNTRPAIDTKAQVEYIVQKNRQLPVSVLPLGAISRGCEGKDLAEMYDMRQSGAVAFSDGIHPVQSSQVLVKALQYVKAFDGVVIQMPDEHSLSKNGLMHEGVVSTRLGLPGKPALAETLLLARDIELLRYTQSKLHITGVSTAAALSLIRKAKQEGLQLTCSVAPYHLLFTDEEVRSYDTNLKVNPPLRPAEDVAALREAVLDGTVDCIASHHQPHEYDSKVCEFEYAKYGMETLETAYGAVMTALPGLDAASQVRLFATAPADIFNLPCPVVEEGATAQLTLFAPGQDWIVDAKDLKSKSANNALIGRQLSGRPLGVVCQQHITVNL